MATEQTPDPQKNPTNTAQPKSSTDKEVDNVEHDKPKSTAQENNSQNPKENTSQIRTNKEPRKRKEWNIGDYIAAISVVVNIVLIFFTYTLWKEAVRSGDTAQNAAQSAKESAKEANRANTIAERNFNLAQLSINNSDSISKENLKLANQSLKAQIASIQTTQKQFEAANTPFLQMDVPHMSIFEIGKPIKLDYTINNLSSNPIKITSKRNSIEFGKYEPTIIVPNEYFSETNLNEYIIINHPTTGFFTTTEKVDTYTYDMIKGGGWSLFIYSEIRYKNLVSKKERIYKCKIKFTFNSSGMAYQEFLLNENEDVQE